MLLLLRLVAFLIHHAPFVSTLGALRRGLVAPLFTAAASGVNAPRVIRYAARVSLVVRVFVVVAAWCLLAGCGDAPILMEPRHRFVDADAPRPAATLRDERRLVLREVTTAPLLSTNVIVTLRAAFSARRALPPALAGNRRLILSPRVRLKTGWQTLPGTIQRVERMTAQNRKYT